MLERQLDQWRKWRGAKHPLARKM